MSPRLRWLACAPLALALSCSPENDPVPEPPRDWDAHPAVIETAAVPVLYALSDVHGGYDRAVALLVANGLLEDVPATPAQAIWSAGFATLVVVGDLIDKGPDSLAVIELFQALEASAPASGGRVVVLMGNHEAEFLADPENKQTSRAGGLADEIRRRGLRPYDVASRADPRGRFLRDLPFAARIGGWFFLHSGDTRGRTIAELSTLVRTSIDEQGYASLAITGPDSILESIGWFRVSESIGQSHAAALGVEHIVFGHDPGGIGLLKSSIAADAGGVLFRIDCGLSPNIDYSDGKLLRVRRKGRVERAESLSATGVAESIWSREL